ncbi:type II toxin-antitoxin system RelE/ParE family toxin [Duganella sp. BuS-21]|uniref:type II toxin-antitoxin system RelE/ParE family toxin n=1 Tax=Duganella sp. BuS-21 TaxID=2943848 RepID=UPI0035A6A25F
MDPSRRQLRWSELAIGDLARIARHVAAYSPANADKLLAQISSQVQLLAAHPQMGRTGVRSGTRELVAHAHYLVIYRVLPDHIDVLRVKHSARKPRA